MEDKSLGAITNENIRVNGYKLDRTDGLFAVAIVAGAAVAVGAATRPEGSQDYIKAQSGDYSKSFNFMWDEVCCGNEALYNVIKIGIMNKSKTLEKAGKYSCETLGKIRYNSDVGLGVFGDIVTTGDTRLTTNILNKYIGNKLCMADRIDGATGSLYIPATDIVLPDIHEEFKIERKYESLNQRTGLLGKGWLASFEVKINKLGEKINVICEDGHIETFYILEGEWVNDKGGANLFTLEEIESCWVFKANKDKKKYCFDKEGKLLYIEDNHGNKSKTTYLENQIETITTFSNYKLYFTYKDSKVIEIKDELGRAVQYRYDRDYLTEVVHMDKGITRYTYDEKGYISSITDQNGRIYAKNFFDKNGRVTRQEYPNGDIAKISYDDLNKEMSVYYEQSERTERTRYNNEGLKTHVFYEDGTTEEYKYDEYQNKIYEKDRNGFEIHKIFSEYGNILKETLPNGLEKEYKYDANQNLIKESDNLGKEIIYIYDNSNNLIEESSKISVGEWKKETYTHDSFGRIISKTDANNGIIEYEYGIDKETSKQIKDPILVKTSSGYNYRYEYDKVGRNKEIRTDYGSIRFSYNSLNYVSKIVDANGNETRKSYDNMGNLISFYPPNNEKTSGYRYKYDHMDRLISIRNPIGAVQELKRDSEGNIIKEINPNNYDLENQIGIEYAYDKDNRKIKTIYPDGGVERLFYDPNGNVIRHISPEYYNIKTDDGLGYSYTYDEMNRLKSIVNEEGILEKYFEYDLHGNIIKEIDNEGNTIFLKYDLLGNIIEKRVPAEKDDITKYNVVIYAYDKNSNKILEKHSTTLVEVNEIPRYYNEIYFTYDSENRLIGVSDKFGAKAIYKYDCLNNKIYESYKINDTTEKIIHYKYDKVGNLIEKKEEIDGKFISPETKGKNIWAITNYEYDGNGNIIKIITPKGYEKGRVYDLIDRVIEEYESDKLNGIYRKYKYSYDDADNIITSVDASTEIEKKKTFKYDHQNRLTHFINASGNTTRLFYDKNDRIIKQVLPEQYKESLDDGVGTTYSYNLKGQAVEVKNALEETVTKNTYDLKGNIKTSIDGENNKVEYKYTLLGKIKDIVTPNAKKENKVVQSYNYDTRGNITGITDGNGNQTSYLLDDWGRITQITTAEGNVEKYTYDYAGNIISTTDGNGGTIEYFYNSLGQVCEIKDQEGESEYFYYDNEGNLTKHIDRKQNHVDRKYNLDKNIVALKAYTIDEEAIELEIKQAEEAKKQEEERSKNIGLTKPSRRMSFTERLKEKKEKQLIEEEESKIIEDPDKHKLNIVNQRFSYNPDGTLKNSYTGNMQYEYTYNIEGMLESKSASGRTLLSYTYDKNSNIKSIKDITGKSSIYIYDKANRVKRIENDKQNNLVFYEYFKNDNIKSVTVGNGVKTDYSYDGDGNIESLVTMTATGEVLVDYNYAYDLNGNRLQKVSTKHQNFYEFDRVNRLKASSYDGIKESFTYDKLGNRLTKTTNDITESYVYNALNQLKELHQKDNKTLFTYDKQGNTIKEESNLGINFFEYNTINQQVKAITKEGNSLVSRYDSEGLRYEIEENEKLTKFIFHKDNILVEIDKDHNSIARFTRGYEVVAAEITNTTEESRYYYTQDEQGSTTFIIAKDQSVKNEYCYDAFGNILEAQEEVHNRITYTGQQLDGITGQYYLIARFYNPVIGRFTQEDVYRGHGLNLYAYCENNPALYCDPSGYASKGKKTQCLYKGDNKGATDPKNY